MEADRAYVAKLVEKVITCDVSGSDFPGGTGQFYKPQRIAEYRFAIGIDNLKTRYASYG